jgi:hypothetical protein
MVLRQRSRILEKLKIDPNNVKSNSTSIGSFGTTNKSLVKTQTKKGSSSVYVRVREL